MASQVTNQASRDYFADFPRIDQLFQLQININVNGELPPTNGQYQPTFLLVALCADCAPTIVVRPLAYAASAILTVCSKFLPGLHSTKTSFPASMAGFTASQ